MSEQMKEQVMEKLFDHLGFDGVDGTYIYCLTRVKEAFHVGTMTMDDFVEVDGDFVGELADLFLEIMAPIQKLAEERGAVLERASRIIDSGMGAGILRYDPVQWFIDYHTLEKGDNQ